MDFKFPVDRRLTEEEVLAYQAYKKLPFRNYKRGTSPFEIYEKTRGGIVIYLSPYKMPGVIGNVLSALHRPVYHTGLAIAFDDSHQKYTKDEVTFGRKGIFWSYAGALESDLREFEDFVTLGSTLKTEKEIYAIIEDMKREYAGEKYDLIKYNCHTFCNDLCNRLDVANIPTKYTLLASDLRKTGSWCVEFASRVGSAVRKHITKGARTSQS